MALFRFSPSLDPINALLDLQRELDRVFENPLLGFDFGLSGRGVYPPVNVFSNKDSYVVKMEVPGLTPEKLTIESHGRTLTITGKREGPAPQEGGSFHRRERSGGEFSRSLQLPADLDLAKAEASYKHGMLTIHIPKREEAKPRQITVKAA
ncbi:MAG TPA: Hsp20/alpha crystallin family protein [Methylomirabilota bacterium]|jgi:HSP20 family protein|nr:Hsp20/alpha crystallin family protein [Methylomirabilota bacterium]